MSDTDKKKTAGDKPQKAQPGLTPPPKVTARLTRPILTPPPEVDEIMKSLRSAHDVLGNYGDPSRWAINLTESLLPSQNFFDDYLKNLQLPDQSYLLTTPIPSTFQPQVSELHSEIARLRVEINEKTQALLNERTNSKQKQEQIAVLKLDVDTLNQKMGLSQLLDRVGAPARERILADPQFREMFTSADLRPAYVVSIDIRRSTELMLKAREPNQYARFVSELAAALREIVFKNLGVFDKFTGDGVLAFFPEFFSGRDAGYRAITAAAEAHAVFRDIFRSHHSSFIAVPRDAGLGIGVDFGKVQIVEIGGTITVVGTPVVYACRMSAAPADTTLLNCPAYHDLFARYACFDFVESSLEVKHEASTIAYEVRPNKKPCEPSLPDWMTAGE